MLKASPLIYATAAQVCYPKQTDKPLYHGLVTQLQSLQIPFVTAEDLAAAPLKQQADIVIDAIFGFSFKGAPRPPFDKILDVSACGCPPLSAPLLLSLQCHGFEFTFSHSRQIPV